MKTPRIYLDTSVIGGCHDAEFKVWSRGLMKDFQLGNFSPVLSELTLLEISFAPQSVQKTLRELRLQDPEILEITEPALALAEVYLERGILPPKFRDDAIHIAIASLSNVEIVVSWNFKHIVHYDKIRLFNAVNLEHGLKSVAIHSPREVTNYEEFDD